MYKRTIGLSWAAFNKDKGNCRVNKHHMRLTQNIKLSRTHHCYDIRSLVENYGKETRMAKRSIVRELKGGPRKKGRTVEKEARINSLYLDKTGDVFNSLQSSWRKLVTMWYHVCGRGL